MIVRIWRTQIDETRSNEYERFAQDRSLPMFRAHAGFRGVREGTTQVFEMHGGLMPSGVVPE